MEADLGEGAKNEPGTWGQDRTDWDEDKECMEKAALSREGPLTGNS